MTSFLNRDLWPFDLWPCPSRGYKIYPRHITCEIFIMIRQREEGEKWLTHSLTDWLTNITTSKGERCHPIRQKKSRFQIMTRCYNPVHIIFHMALIPSRIFLCSNDSLGHNDAPKKALKKLCRGKAFFVDLSLLLHGQINLWANDSISNIYLIFKGWFYILMLRSIWKLMYDAWFRAIQAFRLT